MTISDKINRIKYSRLSDVDKEILYMVKNLIPKKKFLRHYVFYYKNKTVILKHDINTNILYIDLNYFWYIIVKYKLFYGVLVKVIVKYLKAEYNIDVTVNLESSSKFDKI